MNAYDTDRSIQIRVIRDNPWRVKMTIK